jgi:hypothetical protein
MILCSRTNIRPSLLFNQLARLTIKSIANMTRVCVTERQNKEIF